MMVSWCLRYFSTAIINTLAKATWGGKDLLWVTVHGYASPSWGGMAAGEGCSHSVHTQEANPDELSCLVSFTLFVQPRILQQGMMPPTFKEGSSSE